MKVAIFGASGFVGRNIIELFNENSIKYIGSDIQENPTYDMCEYIPANITKYSDVSRVIEECDFVIHLAAHPLPASLKDPHTNADVNICGTLNILEAMRNNSVKNIIFSSASSIVGEVISSPVNENHPCTPKTPYGVAKYATEHYIRVYHELFDINYLTFRFFNVYGNYQYPSGGALIPNVYKKIHAGEPFTIFGNGSATRDYIHVQDISKCYMDALYYDLPNRVVNMGTGVETSILDILDLAESITGISPDTVYLPQRPGEIQNFVSDTRLMREIFSNVEFTSIQSGLKKTFEWLSEQERL